MRWPRGKYNGRRIVGFEMRLQLDVLHWRLWPRVKAAHGPFFIHWLCLLFWAEPWYEWRRR